MEWELASQSNNAEDWNAFFEKAEKFTALLRKEKTEAWEEFASTSNHSAESTKEMKTLQSTNIYSHENPVNITLKSIDKMTIISNECKAELFWKTCAKTSENPPTSKLTRKNMHEMKRNVNDYIDKQNNTNESSLFTCYELDVAIKCLKRRKSCG